jgi:hypothetical protein
MDIEVYIWIDRTQWERGGLIVNTGINLFILDAISFRCVQFDGLPHLQGHWRPKRKPRQKIPLPPVRIELTTFR